MTEKQALVQGALDSLGFKQLPPDKVDDKPIIGGPTKFAATEETLDGLRGATFTVDSDGVVRSG